MACLAQLSMQVPHRMHSAFSILPICTMAFTSRLIGQLLVHFLQSAQAEGSAFSCSDGQASRFRSQRPAIMKGAIQQIV